MNKEIIKIGKYEVGLNSPPFIIAEMSGNHNQSLDRALKIVDEVAKTGAHALKIQTYTPDTMTLNLNDPDFVISDENSLWYKSSLYDLYSKSYIPWDWHEPIFNRARELDLIPFSTPFDNTAVDFLEELDVDCYKIASFENTDIPLIRRVASTGKPLIISTGMASLDELAETVSEARSAGCKKLILLKCTSTYPASPEDTNILTIPHMRELFKCEIGLSDHTLGIGVSIASISLGASVIEKHFTLNRMDGGVDSDFSMEPEEMKRLVIESKRAWQALGEVTFGAKGAELKSMQFRRSLYFCENIKLGEILTVKNVKAIRPGFGLQVKYIDKIVGKTAKKDIKKGTPCSWDLFE